MQRRQFITSIGTIGTLAAAGLARPLAAASADAASAESTGLLNGTPAVFAPTPSSLTITLPLREAALAWIDYGETPKFQFTAASDEWGFVPHDDKVAKIRLTGLKPGTRYHWRATLKPLKGQGKQIRTRVYSHKTLSPKAAETRFSVWNDTHDQAATIQKLHSLRRAEDDFLLWNGDLSNNVNDASRLPGIYVSPKGVDLAEGPPILLTRGNHDVRGIWANKMTDYVDFPTGRPFYAFRSGPMAAITLDTGEDKPDSHPSFKGVAAFEPLIREQAHWLERVIQHPALRSAPYRVVFCHIPLRWTDEVQANYDNKEWDHVSLRGRAVWHDSLVRWGAQVIVSGHNHRATLIPATKKFPYAQLLGGGRGISNATIIRGHADAKQLRLAATMIHDGSIAHEISFNPLA
ncbi:putative phosphodiesterase [Ereboglobus sp. PH5-5]|uniref:purple acid phosphatase family protein n=1 Tax=Ereboglobus sp. PH5-5 TaxID=2940529 RepID=UPI0024053CC8|nr:metallophosphoesterase family protein [Ereboglobus sp. PH5-5]MDF9832000.1 putative phosphodiesterase [Ereboglobus sp. PH5-5]